MTLLHYLSQEALFSCIIRMCQKRKKSHRQTLCRNANVAESLHATLGCITFSKLKDVSIWLDHMMQHDWTLVRQHVLLQKAQFQHEYSGVNHIKLMINTICSSCSASCFPNIRPHPAVGYVWLQTLLNSTIQSFSAAATHCCVVNFCIIRPPVKAWQFQPVYFINYILKSGHSKWRTFIGLPTWRTRTWSSLCCCVSLASWHFLLGSAQSLPCAQAFLLACPR